MSALTDICGATRAAFALRLAQHGLHNVLCHIARPAFGGIEDDHPNRIRILPTQNIFDNGGFVSLSLIGLDISADQRPKVI
jgi:hypothetical protein